MKATRGGNVMKKSRRGFLLGAVMVAITIVLNLFSMPVALADEERAKQEVTQKEYEVETMTVTAQKREENIQNVPVSITALSEIQIEDAGIKDMEDLAYYTPNLHIKKLGSHVEQYPIIRGMYMDMNPNPMVGVFVDGVAYSRFMAYRPL
jgi:iron complex outermembrane receptor protein